jgi:CDP-diglyceride synthetase
MQITVAVLLFLLSIIVGNIVFVIVCAFISFILIKDCFKIAKTEYEVNSYGIYVRVAGNVVKKIKWSEIKVITRTRKNPKWIVVGHGSSLINIKPTIENYLDMAKEVVEHKKGDNSVYIHHTIPLMIEKNEKKKK